MTSTNKSNGKPGLSGASGSTSSRVADTPQTNAVITAIFDRDGFLSEHNAPESLVVLCRKLERQNIALRMERDDTSKDVMRDALKKAAARFREPRFGCEWEDAAEDCERAAGSNNSAPADEDHAMIHDCEIITYKTTEALDSKKRVGGPHWLGRWVRRLYLWKYGVRGGIKPPLGPGRGQRMTLRYRWKYFFWRLESRIYRATGIPDEWFNRVYGTPNTQAQERA